MFFLLFDKTMNIQLLMVSYRKKLLRKAELTKVIYLHSKILWLMQCKIQTYKKNMLILYILVNI